MAFELEHTVVSTSFTPTVHKAGGDGYGTVNVEGEMQLLHPGRLDVRAIARFEHRTRVELPPGPTDEDTGSDSQGGRFKTETIAIPVRVTFYTPDGHEFTGSEVRLADLRRVRDLRGSPIGPWRYKLSGESEHRSLDDLDTVRALRGFFVVKVIETVRSESAGPLVSGVSLDGSRQSVEFDLFRVGTLVAELSNVTAEWRGTLSLVRSRRRAGPVDSSADAHVPGRIGDPRQVARRRRQRAPMAARSGSAGRRRRRNRRRAEAVGNGHRHGSHHDRGAAVAHRAPARAARQIHPHLRRERRRRRAGADPHYRYGGGRGDRHASPAR